MNTKKKFYRKYGTALIVALTLIFTMIPTSTVYASDNSESMQTYTVSEALNDEEVRNFLIETGEIYSLLDVQKQAQTSRYTQIAEYARGTMGSDDISAADVSRIIEKYNLDLPEEENNVTNSWTTVVVQRDAKNALVDTWLFSYHPSDSAFSVVVSGIDAGNVLDSVTGSLSCNYLNNTTWTNRDRTTFEKTNVTNGVVFTWYISKWGVKERFEYTIVVRDNGGEHRFTNLDDNYEYVRYNFDAKPYTAFTANGGQRHHFVPATALNNNGFNSNSAYCIRMMTADHRKTGSYGNSSYVADSSNLLANGRYEEALQKEVNDMQVKIDSESSLRSLYLKYYDEIVVCLIQYERLFGIS